MRRILRKLIANKPEEIGDSSTLANPNIISELAKTISIN